MAISKDLSSAASIKERMVTVGKVKDLLYYSGYPAGAKIRDFNLSRGTSYGLVDQFGSAVEPIYDHCITELAPGISVMNFVADQFFSMKRRFEEKSNKSGIYGVLEPVRAITPSNMISVKYDSYLDELMEAYVSYIFEMKNTKIITFSDFCREFLFYIKNTRVATISGGLPISKVSFINTSRVDFLSSGLVIDFKDNNYNDISKTHSEWMADINFDLFCSAAKTAGFYIDSNHPYRIVADLASKKMQRSAEFFGASYQPGSSGSVFQEFYLQAGLYDFIVIKNKLLSFYTKFQENNPIIYHKKPCNNKIKCFKQPREKLSLTNLDLPPIPKRKKDPAANPLLQNSNVNKIVAYGLHSDKYNLAFFTTLYIEIRFLEIRLASFYLTEKEKAVIIKKALKHIVKGDIRSAYQYICRQFDGFRIIPH